MIDVVIASIPYHLSGFWKREEQVDADRVAIFGCGQDGSEKSLPGLFLILPLVFVEMQDSLTYS